ncbi:DNA mismatch endonuclease Vsr [Burkholderia cenocepacia]|uniref:very short patch repair endonuclease n=1 Tax=Burkholderia cenocepacia TaxID=95486 RepID=UPI001B95E194|nr:very short patch repair endonuclease [Burkholderia cenocepacia]MBR8024603.1 DNA mismatch endonuclease Vsr [Burkholderia cenocepacia]MBR8171626.1 DNA mismatch endonuclease Vsr [Burkholderia cenocepacia]
MDKVTPHQRSLNMAAVRSRNTKPELVVRHALHSMGLRFRLHQTALPGSPDIVLKRHRTVILVHGCFWHGHSCPRGQPPATRLDFWLPKLERNRVRDRRQARQLRGLGWRILTVWECQTKDPVKLTRRLARYFEASIDHHG